MDKSQQLSQLVEKEVRQMLGELTMQTIVLRAALALAGQPQPGEPGQQPIQPNTRPGETPPPQPHNPNPPPTTPPRETEPQPEAAASRTVFRGQLNGQREHV